MISPIHRTRSTQFCRLATALAVLALLAAPAAADVLVPYGGPIDGTPGWSYQVGNPGFEAGFQAFPCSTTDPWNQGVTPFFGDGPGAETCDITADAETEWVLNTDPAETDILLCYTLELCEGATIDSVALHLDNDAAVWVNGVAGTVTGGVGQNNDGAAPFCWSVIPGNPPTPGPAFSADGLCNTEGCADGPDEVGEDKVIFTDNGLPWAAVAGSNTIHVRARDRHQLAYLDVKVEGTPGTCAEVCEGDDDDDDDDDDDEEKDE